MSHWRGLRAGRVDTLLMVYVWYPKAIPYCFKFIPLYLLSGPRSIQPVISQSHDILRSYTRLLSRSPAGTRNFVSLQKIWCQSCTIAIPSFYLEFTTMQQVDADSLPHSWAWLAQSGHNKPLQAADNAGGNPWNLIRNLIPWTRVGLLSKISFS